MFLLGFNQCTDIICGIVIRKLVVLDLSDNPVASFKNYKRNILHLIPSLEVLDDLKIGFETFRKKNDYTTRYLNAKKFNESRDPNGYGFLWSGRPGRWDGIVFQAANSIEMNGDDIIALTEACAGSDMTDFYGIKNNAKKYPWRRDPDIEPRPLHFNSAAEENNYRAKTPTKPFSPMRSQRSVGQKSPGGYVEMSQDKNYLSTVLSQHMERPDWNKYFKPVPIGVVVSKDTKDEDKGRTKKGTNYRSSSGTWVDDNRPVYMGGPMSPNTAAEYHGRPKDSLFIEDLNVDTIGRDGNNYDSPYRSEKERSDDGYLFSEAHEDTVDEKLGISHKDLENTLLELVEHKKALLRKLQDARAARKSV